MATISGTTGVDSLDGDRNGVPEDDVFLASQGQDTLDGRGGTDTYTIPGGSLPGMPAAWVNVDLNGNGTVGYDVPSDDDTVISIETFIADERSGADALSIGTATGAAVQPDQVTGGILDGAGIFTASTGETVPFGGVGQPTLQDVLDGNTVAGTAQGTYLLNSFVTPASGSTAVESGTIGTISFENFEFVAFNVVCFVRDAMIRTADGAVPVQDLNPGDAVATRDQGVQPIRWIGSRRVPALGAFAPVVITAGALGNDRDLRVSPQHRMLLTGWRAELMFGEPEVLVAAKHLVNGDTIYIAEGGVVEYFHMLFDRHQIVSANGAWSESFHPGTEAMGTLSSETREEIYALFPELRDDVCTYGPAARPSLKAYEARALTTSGSLLN